MDKDLQFIMDHSVLEPSYDTIKGRDVVLKHVDNLELKLKVLEMLTQKAVLNSATFDGKRYACVNISIGSESTSEEFKLYEKYLKILKNK